MTSLPPDGQRDVAAPTPGSPSGPFGRPSYGSTSAAPGVGLRAPAGGEAAMGLAIAEARACLEAGDVPVGAVVVDGSGDVVGAGRNGRERDGDPTAHAEVLALRDAARSRPGWRLDGCTLVVTLEPCVMCAGALVASRADRVVFGAWDPKAGACGSVWDLTRDRAAIHRVEVVGGVREDECARLLLAFFEARRTSS